MKNTKKCLFCENEFLPDYRKTNLFCSLNCSAQHRAKESFEKNYQLFLEGKLRYRSIIYKIISERDGNACSVCNIDANNWNGKPLRLWVDHIDGDASNNNPSNFRLICPNCESQTDTSRGKNYGKGRKSKGLPCYG